MALSRRPPAVDEAQHIFGGRAPGVEAGQVALERRRLGDRGWPQPPAAAKPRWFVAISRRRQSAREPRPGPGATWNGRPPSTAYGLQRVAVVAQLPARLLFSSRWRSQCGPAAPRCVRGPPRSPARPRRRGAAAVSGYRAALPWGVRPGHEHRQGPRWRASRPELLDFEERALQHFSRLPATADDLLVLLVRRDRRD